MQFVYDTFISCQATHSTSYVFELRIKTHNFLLSFDCIAFVMTMYIFMCVNLNKLCDREMKVYYVTNVLNQCINIETMCPKYIPEIRNTKSHLMRIYIGA